MRKRNQSDWPLRMRAGCGWDRMGACMARLAPTGGGCRRRRRRHNVWGGAAFGDSPLSPGAPTPLTRGGSSGQRRQLPHRLLLGACVRVQVAGSSLEIGVPRQLLDGADVHAVADEVGGELQRIDDKRHRSSPCVRR